ncbi:MAG: hypothetical protein A3F35_03140 [Candidatus Woykebacteria bacterium RIFCSPHIGHO2_12_FULL_45_10]|uniref:Vitamin K epoxide reductase domain-containing protein n=1 Tax=Candidatus Woykebacteria bacterium RIFCSPHIGHO2_12_FULL_45_10 TaxID=1802603 RepID=A0A1G1WN53_9BACT|nr:MAG: hypothetical protein A3F35_03140 [Candidatus Woykebacteria bacterium RIFCSPHIGHO2_12_FULL_45_10]
MGIYLNRIIFFLTLSGLAISFYLLYTYTASSPIVCLNSGCETVRASPYAYFFGVPLPAFGALMYVGIFVLSFLRTTLSKNQSGKIAKAILSFSFVGVAISAYLTYLEAFKIHAYCLWCVSSAVVISLIFLVSLFEVRRLDANSA